MRKRKTLALAAAALLAFFVAAAFFLVAPGGIDTYSPDRALAAAAVPSGAPGWTEPCWRRAPRADRRLLERCARVEGRVVWVQSDAEQDGRQDVHLLVTGGFDLYSVKVPVGTDPPGRLSRVDVVGALVEDRHGVEEVDAVAID